MYLFEFPENISVQFEHLMGLQLLLWKPMFNLVTGAALLVL